MRGEIDSRPPLRRGAVLAILIVVMIIVGVLAIGLTKLLLARHRLQTIQQRHQQAVELARTGVDRAAAQLARSPDYEGETWTIPADQLGGDAAAAVTIKIARSEDGDSLRRVVSRAVWGEGEDAVRHSDEVVIDIELLQAND